MNEKVAQNALSCALSKQVKTVKQAECFSVVTYNVHTYMDQKIQNIAKHLSDEINPDILCLQEHLSSANLNTYGYPYVAKCATEGSMMENVILSRFPIVYESTIPIEDLRVSLWCVIKINCVFIVFLYNVIVVDYLLSKRFTTIIDGSEISNNNKRIIYF